MSTPGRRVHYSYEQYLGLEDGSPIRHEYLNGEIYAMAGGTPDHAALAARVIALLSPRMPSECRAFTSDLRIRIAATGLSTYPDVAVICGRTVRAPDDGLAVINPVLLVEITSDSTEEYDRGEKLVHYKALPTVREVVIVSHREARVTLHRRAAVTWTATEMAAGATIELESVAVRLPVDDLYRDGLEDIRL